VIVVRRGNPCTSIARNGSFGLPPSAFSTATRALMYFSSLTCPVSIGNEISGRCQPRQSSRPSSQPGAPSTGSGLT
jgi:hypothetical protein